MRKKYLLLGGLLLLSCTQRPLPMVMDGAMAVQDHLSNQRVNAFAEDRLGQIWMGTFRGLNKYTPPEDFHQYFCTDDTLGLPDNQINHVLSSSKGDLWIATVNGVAVKTETGCFRRIAVPDGNRNISQILETRSGEILLHNGSVLMRYDAGKDVLVPVLRDLNAFGTPAVIVDRQDRLWVSNGATLSIYSTEDFSRAAELPSSHLVYHQCLVGDSELWLSGMGRFSIIDTRTLKPKSLPEALTRRKEIMEGDIDQLFSADGGAVVLLNVIGAGMFCYYPAQDRVVRQGEAGFPYDVPDAEIRTIFQDSRHNLWFGTTDQGYAVSYYYKNQFDSNKFLTSYFHNKCVTSLCLDLEGLLWITTQRDGMFVYDRGKGSISPVPVDYLIPDNKVGYIRCNKVFVDAQGEYWLLFTDKFQVLRCRRNGLRFVPIDRIGSFIPLSIAQDDRGRIWIGSMSPDLQVYDKDSRELKSVSLGQWTFVTNLLPTEPGQILVGAFNMPMLAVNNYTDEVHALPLTPEEEAACIRRSVRIPNNLYKDSAGDVWLGTITNGLMHRDGKTGATTPVQGVSCEDIASIQEDRQGNIWVSTLNGLGKWDRTLERFVNYYQEDGIGGNQFSDRASCIYPDGTLVFGGTHGLTWFNPLDVSRKRPVSLVFQDLTIHNQLVRPAEDGPMATELENRPDIVIQDQENGFSISFAALDYSGNERTSYYYMMEGFDKYWVAAGAVHEAYYANLPAGNYRFRVKIDNNSNSIVETESFLRVKVLPPWYATWWAILLWVALGLLLLGIGYTFWRHVRRVHSEAARHIREERREREKAEEAEAAEKELNKIQMNYFSNVAHEFRTPLTMIAGPVSQLSASPTIKGEDRQLVGIIQRSATWMLSLVNQLLDFNRIGNKKLQMKVAKMDVSGPLRDIASLFRCNAESKGIDFVTYGLEEPFTMWVDADKMQKIVMNLLSNAIKFTPPGGKVSLSFDVVSREEAAARFPLTEADTDGQYASISVADTGPGIPEDQLEKIFERFFQASSRQETQGSGIGLFYARALCGFHHGYIKAWNREEGGALFNFILPVSAGSYTEDERTTEPAQLQIMAPMQAASAAETQTEAGRRHIAIVDDDIDIANYLKILLSPAYKVSVYFDGASALKGMQEENAPDLVISDVVMPGMSGYELCEAIKGNLQLSHIPVVLVTAKVAVENQVQGLDKGADAYVTKPFQPAYLTALVKSLLENREKLHRQLGSVTTTEDIAPEALSPRDAAFMKDLYELMEKELANNDLDITRMTEMMKISRTKFYYKVKGLTGENPSVFFKRYKLNRAADLLKEGKYNMSEIAYMTGFNTLSHFSTSFKKQFGVPPSEYVG